MLCAFFLSLRKQIGCQSWVINALRSKNTKCFIECSAFWLTLTACHFSFGTSCLVLCYFSSASLFSRGLCPHPFAFCKKRNQKLLCFLSLKQHSKRAVKDRPFWIFCFSMRLILTVKTVLSSLLINSKS